MENLYFIALVPPEPIAGEVTAIKEDFAQRFDSKAALKVVPHITLKTPFRLEENRHDPLLAWFAKMHIPVQPFALDLNGFGSFPKIESPVVYVNPKPNESLKLLQKEMIRSFQRRFPEGDVQMDKRFVAHMTVAYRDLSLEQYEMAWMEYRTRSYAASWPIEEVHLLQHDTKQWNAISIRRLPVDTGRTLAIEF